MDYNYKYKTRVVISDVSDKDEQTTKNIERDVSVTLGAIDEEKGKIVSVTQTHLTPEKMQTTIIYEIDN